MLTFVIRRLLWTVLVMFVITVIVFKVIAASIMIFFPEVARRIFPGSYHTLGWGGYFALELVGAQALIVGVFAFVGVLVGVLVGAGVGEMHAGWVKAIMRPLLRVAALQENWV